MTKKYAILRLESPKAEGGFWEAFRLGLVELGCSGEEFYDASGYPFPDEVHAFVYDWINLSGDFQTALQKVDGERGQHSWVGEVHGQGQGRQPASEQAGK